jgi:hypothetical protein
MKIGKIEFEQVRTAMEADPEKPSVWLDAQGVDFDAFLGSARMQIEEGVVALGKDAEVDLLTAYAIGFETAVRLRVGEPVPASDPDRSPECGVPTVQAGTDGFCSLLPGHDGPHVDV